MSPPPDFSPARCAPNGGLDPIADVNDEEQFFACVDGYCRLVLELIRGQGNDDLYKPQIFLAMLNWSVEEYMCFYFRLVGFIVLIMQHDHPNIAALDVHGNEWTQLRDGIVRAMIEQEFGTKLHLDTMAKDGQVQYSRASATWVNRTIVYMLFDSKRTVAAYLSAIANLTWAHPMQIATMAPRIGKHVLNNASTAFEDRSNSVPLSNVKRPALEQCDITIRACNMLTVDGRTRTYSINLQDLRKYEIERIGNNNKDPEAARNKSSLNAIRKTLKHPLGLDDERWNHVCICYKNPLSLTGVRNKFLKIRTSTELGQVLEALRIQQIHDATSRRLWLFLRPRDEVIPPQKQHDFPLDAKILTTKYDNSKDIDGEIQPHFEPGTPGLKTPRKKRGV